MSRGAKLWTGTVQYMRGFTRIAVEKLYQSEDKQGNVLKHEHYEMFGLHWLRIAALLKKIL